MQVLSTLLPIAGLWALVVTGTAQGSASLVIGATALLTLFLIRSFVLMHECGHGSLFCHAAFNPAFGFVFGTLSGISQAVWADRHNYHHATNGNWARYRGPLNVITVDEYRALSAGQQQRYRLARNIWFSPIAGLLYFIVMPRVNWLISTCALLIHLARGLQREPRLGLRAHLASFSCGCCSNARHYGHMLTNNLALLAFWGVMISLMDPLVFFACYTLSLSLAGAAAIVMFTVQHNFEGSYATDDENWDRTRAALEGTSFLILPGWLNWFTANIAYHHVHHLCANVPNYRLAACHEEMQARFTQVRRIPLSAIPHALTHILWDRASERIVSVRQAMARVAPAVAPPEPPCTGIAG